MHTCSGTLTDVYPLNEYADVHRTLCASPSLTRCIGSALGGWGKGGGGAHFEPLLHNALQLQHHASKRPHALQLFKLHTCSCQHVPDLRFLKQLQHPLHNSCAQSTCLQAAIGQMRDGALLFVFTVRCNCQ